MADVSAIAAAPWLLDADDVKFDVMSDAPDETRSELGFLLERRLLSYEAAEACRVEAIAALSSALSGSMQEAAPLFCTDAYATPFRYTVKLGLTPAVTSALLEFRSSSLASVIEAELGEDAALVGLSCALTERGAASLPPHQPVLENHQPCLRAHVALGRASRQCGAMLIWPGSHSDDAVPCDEDASLCMDLGSGDGLLSGPELWCGACSHIGMRRYAVSLVLTFAPPAMLYEWCGPDVMPILPHLLGRLSVANMGSALQGGHLSAPRPWASNSEADAWYLPPGSPFLPPGSEYLRRNAAGVSGSRAPPALKAQLAPGHSQRTPEHCARRNPPPPPSSSSGLPAHAQELAAFSVFSCLLMPSHAFPCLHARAQELAAFSDDGWLFGSFGDAGDLGGSVRMDPAGSHRQALQRSMQQLHAISRRLSLASASSVAATAPAAAVPAAAVPAAAPVAAVAAPTVDVPRPLVEVLLALVCRLPNKEPRVRKCLEALQIALRGGSGAMSGAISVEGEEGIGPAEEGPVRVPLVALGLIRSYRVAGEHIHTFLDSLLSTGSEDMPERAPQLTAAELAARWRAAHDPRAVDRSHQAHGERTRAADFAEALDASTHGDTRAVLAWVDDGKGSIDARGGQGPSTLLMNASAAGQSSTVRALLRRHASLDIQDDNGSTALHLAASHGSLPVVRRLLLAGATLDVCDVNGESALHRAERFRHLPTARLLRGQTFAPRTLRGLLSAAEASRLVRMREALGSQGRTFMDGCTSHEVLFLHARRSRPIVEQCGCASLVEMLMQAMRQADPRRPLRRGDDHHRLTVRSCELHTYAQGGALMDRDHRDAGSSITMSVLLSDPAQSTGGDFLTWEAAARGVNDDEPHATAIPHRLGRGDAILFRSEDYHNVSPITSGTRHSLVIELWAGVANDFDRNS